MLVSKRKGYSRNEVKGHPLNKDIERRGGGFPTIFILCIKKKPNLMKCDRIVFFFFFFWRKTGFWPLEFTKLSSHTQTTLG